MFRYGSQQSVRPGMIPIARVGEGTPYGVQPAELDILQDAHMNSRSRAWRPLNPPISQEEALARLLAPSARKQPWREAMNRIREGNVMQYAIYDFLIKIFNDLDTVIFHNKLRRRVYSCWRYLSETDPEVQANPNAVLWAQANPAGFRGQQRIAIELNLQAPWGRVTRQDTMGVLVHEMLHAWYMVHCGIPHDVVLSQDMDVHHGYYFHSARVYIEQNYNLKLLSEPSRGR